MFQQHILVKILRSRMTLFVLSSILIFSFIAIGSNYIEYRSYEKELTNHKATIDQLSQDNLQLSDLLTYLNSDDAVYAYARTRLGMQEVGERAFIITEDTIESNTRVDDIEIDVERNAHKWFRYYFAN